MDNRVKSVKFLKGWKYKYEPSRAEECNNWNKNYRRRNKYSIGWFRRLDQWNELEDKLSKPLKLNGETNFKN